MGRFEDCTTARALSLAASRSTRSDVDDEGVLAVSLYDDSLSERRIWYSTQRIFAAIFKDESDGLCEICTSLGGRASLTICARDLWRVRDKPVVCAFDDCSELVVHAMRVLLRCSIPARAGDSNFSRAAQLLHVPQVTTSQSTVEYDIAMHAAEALHEVSERKTLEQVFRWAIRQRPPFIPADVVIQDEFTHDVIFRATDGSALVFDAT